VIDNGTRCPLCSDEIESSSHLFNYNFSYLVWQGCYVWLGFQPFLASQWGMASHLRFRDDGWLFGLLFSCPYGCIRTLWCLKGKGCVYRR